MDELSIIKFILKIENMCIKECQKKVDLIEFKSCYNKCKNDQKIKNEIVFFYINDIVTRIKYPSKFIIERKIKKDNHTNLSAFHFPDYYFKTKGDEMDVRNPKHSVGTLFARNK